MLVIRGYNPMRHKLKNYAKMNNIKASVVIRTYNEQKYLPDLLEALRGQTFPDFEIIVVDSGSLDKTREFAESYADKILQLKSRDFTFGYALNIGIQEASSNFIAIASAHTLPINAVWLEMLISPLYDEQNAMVYGRQLGTNTSKFSEKQDFRRTYGLTPKVLRFPNFFANNANSAIRKDLWQQYQFDESLLGLEDIDWAKYWMEKGLSVVYEPEAALYHIHEESWRQIRRRYYREAVAARWIGTAAVRQAIANPVIEAALLLLDWRQLLKQRNGKHQEPVGLLGTVKETALFRANKSIGTVKGLLGGSIMENPKDREALLFDRSCKAVVVSGPGQAALEEVQIPEVKPGDVLIRTAYEAVCATDIEIYEGSLGYYKSGKAKYPIIPGHEFSGTLVDRGPNVNHVEIGDSVVVECIQSCGTCEACQKHNWIGCHNRTELGVIGRNGGYSEYVVVPGRFVHRLPSNFDMRKACLCEPLAVVLKGLKRFSRTWGKKNIAGKCAVVGAGSLGHLFAKVLELKGHQVTVFDRDRRRLEYFQGSGIEVSDNLSSIYEYDNLVEVTGNPEALDIILHESRTGAKILLLGLPYAHREYTFESIVAYDKMIIGSVGSAAKHFDMAIELLPQINTDLFTEKIMDLSEFRQAWDLVRSQKFLKVILKIA